MLHRAPNTAWKGWADRSIGTSLPGGIGVLGQSPSCADDESRSPFDQPGADPVGVAS